MHSMDAEFVLKWNSKLNNKIGVLVSTSLALSKKEASIYRTIYLSSKLCKQLCIKIYKLFLTKVLVSVLRKVISVQQFMIFVLKLLYR